MGDTITIFTYNILESGTVTVTGSPDTGFPEARLYDRSISLYWKDTVTEAKVFHVDQGATGILAVDFLAIARHNFNGEDLQWQYSIDDFAADTNDAVTDWSQSDNLQIIKEMVASQTKRYWRVTLTSMANPRCAEIFMGLGYEFTIQATPGTTGQYQSNVRWNRSVGGSERSTKFGDRRRVRSYPLFLDSTDLDSLRTALGYLEEYSYPFWIKDHEGEYWLCRLTDDPVELWNQKTRKNITLNVIEQL